MKVTLAYPWTDEDGKEHEPDKTVTVPDHVGQSLIFHGRARTPDVTATTSSSSTPRKAAAKAAKAPATRTARSTSAAATASTATPEEASQ